MRSTSWTSPRLPRFGRWFVPDRKRCGQASCKCLVNTSECAADRVPENFHVLAHSNACSKRCCGTLCGSLTSSDSIRPKGCIIDAAIDYCYHLRSLPSWAASSRHATLFKMQAAPRGWCHDKMKRLMS